MKHYLLLLCALFIGWTGISQERYLDPVFEEVTVTKDVKYGENYTVISVPLTGKATLEDLLLDVYEPTEDTSELRPLVILAHTGNFLPHPVNGSISGNKNIDSTSIEVSRRLARMGYVAANIDYRLGWNPLAPTVEERTNTLINAAYRGVQDFRTAVRFFKKEVAENGNPYRVDTSRIVGWGFGTGSYLSLISATLDSYEDIIIPKFIGSDITGDNQPDPMVIPQIHGDIYGTSVGLNPLTGDTLSVPNHVGYNSDFHLTVNVGGAIGDSSWIDPDDGPFISYHVPTDPFGPYKEGPVIVPTTQQQVVTVQGSFIIDSLANVYGNNQVFSDLGLDDPVTRIAESRRGGIAGLMPLIGSAGPNDSAPWQFWDKETNPNSDNELMLNPNMSREKAMGYIDTILWFFAPRAFAVLELDEVSATENLAFETGLKIYPNLVTHDCIVETDPAHPFEAIYIYDQQGRVMKHIRNIRTNRLTLDLSGLSGGLYFARIVTAEGSSVSRIIKQ